MWRNAWRMVKDTVGGFGRDDLMTKAAALALYTALGLAPIVLLILAVTAWLGPATQQAVIGQIDSVVGSQAAKSVAEVVKSTKQEQQRQASGSLSAIIGLIAVLISTSGIFAQLQASLNDIWGVKPNPRAGWWRWLRARLLSVGTLLSVLFLMLVSLLLSAGIALLFAQAKPLWNIVSLIVSFAVYVVLFALIFKVLPDAKMRWRDVWVGAAITAVLFAIGKHLIGLYLSHSAVASSYGAAGSLLALIVWVYYSAIIVFVGAEAAQAFARRFGAGIEAGEYAVPKNGQDAERAHPHSD
ncbi:MAG: YihY/virulence factor BrkB family protein [Thermoguttaceae bacterium]